MKLQILSDLHLEFRGATLPPFVLGTDVMVLAGDLAPHWTEAIGVVSARWQAQGADTILYVPGNHEFYGSDIEDARQDLREQCDNCGVTLLDRDAVTIEGVHFIGATLWTDFLLNGVQNEFAVKSYASRYMSDFNGAITDSFREDIWTPEASIVEHKLDRRFIAMELRKANFLDLTPVVITHHAPSGHCVHPKYARSNLNAAFASNMDAFIDEHQPLLWIHGHMHDLVDVQLGETRVVCNPQGYPKEGKNKSGPQFDPEFIIDVKGGVVGNKTKDRLIAQGWISDGWGVRHPDFPPLDQRVRCEDNFWPGEDEDDEQESFLQGSFHYGTD